MQRTAEWIGALVVTVSLALSVGVEAKGKREKHNSPFFGTGLHSVFLLRMEDILQMHSVPPYAARLDHNHLT